MKLKVFKPLWGHIGSLEDAIAQAVDAQFDGIEGSAPLDSVAQSDFDAGMKAAGLEYIAEVFTGGNYVPDPEATPEAHLDDLRQGIERSLELSPRFLNTQCGLDAWDLPTQIDFYSEILKLEVEYDLSITIETHRSRSTFTPWVTREIARALPDLKLNLDFSHWCCVAERLVVDDDPALLDFFAQRAWHMHARVGYDQGPQVPDPRAPEYEADVRAHLDWWRRVWEIQQERGFSENTMTPEFGTDGYLHLEPYSRKPVADLWEVNRWMASRLRKEFTEFSAAE